MSTLPARFADKYVPEPNSGCWLWLGATKDNGYGVIRHDGERRQAHAHRASYEIHYGVRPPDDLCVMHKCDVRCCVNPEHLVLGTKADNSQDMARKGRGELQKDSSRVRGARNPKAKLGDTEIARIRELLADGCGQVEIASWFGVAQAHISSIKLGKCWRVA